jgi:hypothetical protein
VDLDRPEEEAWFAESAMNAYKSFRDKAALSRSMKVCCKIALGMVVPEELFNLLRSLKFRV